MSAIQTGQAPAVDAAQTDSAVCEVFYVDEAQVKAAAALMPPQAVVQEVAQVFQVLSDPTRTKIVFALSHAELCVCDLATLLDMSNSAISHQLRFLRALGLVTYRKQGRFAYYSLTDEHVQRLLRDVTAHVQLT